MQALRLYVYCAVAMAAVITVTNIGGARADEWLQVLQNVNVRTAPSLSATIVYVALQGSYVDVVCQTTGDTVGSTDIWDMLADDNYVFDAYVYTGTDGFSSTLPRC